MKSPISLLIFALLLIGLMGSASAVANYSSTSDKIFFYKYNEATGTAITDEVGTYNTNYDAGQPTWIDGRSGFGSAGNISSGATHRADTGFQPSALQTANLSLEFRGKTSSSASTIIMGTVSGADPTKKGFTIIGGTNFKVIATDGASAILNEFDFGCSVSNNNEWHHIVLTINSTDGYTMYQDGARCPNSISGSINGASTTNFFLHNRPTANAGWNGALDQVIWWNKTLTLSEIVSLNNSVSDSSSISTILNSPNNNTFHITPINFSATISQNDLTNATLYIWNSTGIFNQSTQTISGTTNTTTWLNSFNVGSYTWNVFGCSLTECSWGVSNRSFVYGYQINSLDYLTGYETSYQDYVLNINASSLPSSAYLNFNGTYYIASVSTSGTNYNLTYNNLPISSSMLGSKNINFNFTIGGVPFISSVYTQSLLPISLGLCNSSINVTYLNITFKNETIGNENVKAQISSTFLYWLNGGLQANNKSLSIVNTTENYNYPICFSPSDKSLDVIPSIIYYNSDSPQRNYAPANSETYSNSTTTRTLSLLPNSLGFYVTFQVLNSAGQAVTGATVNISSSTFGLVEQRITDGSGGATFWLNPLSSYTVCVSATGYPATCQAITPSSSQYTITLGTQSTTGTTIDTGRGISYAFAPTQTYLVNDTTYSFQFALNSTYWELDSFGYTLTNSSGYVLATTSSTDNGGVLSQSVNVGSNKKIIMSAYWITSGNTTTVTKTWYVYDSSGSGNSISNFISDFKSYVTSGDFFGITPFALNLIVFFLIFLGTGIFSYKFGLGSPVAVIGVMLILTAILDVGLDLITYSSSLPNHSATMIVSFLMIAYAVKESYS